MIPTNHMQLKKKNHSVDALNLCRTENKIITGARGREGEGKGHQEQILEGTGEKYRGSGN